MIKLSESQHKVLKDINESVPKAWWGQLTKEVFANPVIREFVDRGLLKDITPELRAKLEIIKRSDEYKEVSEVVNEEIEKKIDEHFTRKVRQAIKKGLLPPLTKENYVKPRTVKKED